MEPTSPRHPSAFSASVDAAMTLAAAAHEGQRRKGTEIPYVMHPNHVARILDRHGCGEHLVIAGLLHDVVEDARFDDVQWRDRDGKSVPDSFSGRRATPAASALRWMSTSDPRSAWACRRWSHT